MSSYLETFIEFFGLDTFGSGTLTVQQTIGATLVCFAGIIITIVGVRCVLELIKIVTDWSKFN